jgi:hypothetical protein
MGSGNWTGWTDAVWDCIKLMGHDSGSVITLQDVYSAVPVLQRMYPDNDHIEDKIRQQLQIMKDFGRLEFVNNQGVYRIL